MIPPRVLAIRPQPALAAMLGSALDLTRFELESCTGNVEAMQCLRARNIDVVITDAQTTVSEDLALAAELKELRPAVRIILLAPDATHGELVEAIRAHVFACFTPPFEYGEIAAMASRALQVDNWRDGIQVISGSDQWLTLQVSCHLLTADRLVRFMSELQSAAPAADRDLLIGAFREMLLNAMEYGAGFDPEKVIQVTATKTARAIAYHFKDPGAGFDRTEIAHAAASSGPQAVLSVAMQRAETGPRPGGFGMLIARHVADELVYNERGDEVLLIKHTDRA
jgi:anti-sigma regulatory factor (Ser/Thr protein kinase)/ActR/RegA family two-component response regulator